MGGVNLGGVNLGGGVHEPFMEVMSRETISLDRKALLSLLCCGVE